MKHLTSPVPYREDINGLRAWAVIAVLFFHFQLPGFGAGFIGVDIFFVISGFLMTVIIIKGLESNKFSIWQFYVARARRIMPALMMMILVLLLLGWHFLPTPDLQALGTQSTYSLSFLSNFYFWRSAGYFDAAAHEKWLLHTWSLAVEAQFYILYPIFLIILWKIKPNIRTIFWGLALLSFFSFVLSIVASQWRPTAAFYLLPTRGWELAAGGFAFLIGREIVMLKKYSNLMWWIGFGLLAISLLLVNRNYAWPSGWAMLPVLGTVLIILAHQTRSKLTVNPVTQWLGERSYSLYLWHWVLVVALYYDGLQNDWLLVSGAIALSLLLAHISYHFVEIPARSYLSVCSLRNEIFTIMIAGLLIGFSAHNVGFNVYENRLKEGVDRIAMEVFNGQKNGHICGAGSMNNKNLCVHSVNERSTVDVGAIIWGDSHANAVATALGLAMSENFGALELSSPGCLPILNVKFQSWTGLLPANRCTVFNDFALSEIQRRPGVPLFLSARWTAALIGIHPDEIGYQHERVNVPKIYFENVFDDAFDEGFVSEISYYLTETICPLVQNRDVFIVMPIPEMGKNVPQKISRKMLFYDKKIDIYVDKNNFTSRHDLFNKIVDNVKNECGLSLLYPSDYLCDEKSCKGSIDGFPLYYDDDHLSEYGNKILVEMFRKSLLDI